MTRKVARDWRGLGCSVVLGAAIAFPVGIIIGNGQPEKAGTEITRPDAARGNRAPPARNPYSPNVGSDPYVIDQQRRVVEALETNCRHFHSHCTEAQQARLRLNEAEVGK